MPELPEVETIVRGLQKDLKDCLITDVDIREQKVIGFPDSDSFRQLLNNIKIEDIHRRGKYIVFHLQHKKKKAISLSGKQLSGETPSKIEYLQHRYLIVHLRMTGKLLIKNKNDQIHKHTHVIFHLNNSYQLRFNNVRKFGRMYLVDENKLEKAGGFCKLGPEPLARNFTVGDFKELFTGRSRIIKALLLQQDFVAGLGNIYTDEALFRAGIDPRRKANSLQDKEIRQLYQAVREVLREGIKYCGTSISDYVNSWGESGSFQQRLRVYQKDGQPCSLCGQEIMKIKAAGRGTHFCPHCQN